MLGSLILLVLTLVAIRFLLRGARKADRAAHGKTERPLGVHPKDHRELSRLAKLLEGLYDNPKKEKR